MLRVKIELVPYGEEENARQIGEMVIANDMTGGRSLGNYVAWQGKDDWTGKPEQLIKYRGFDRHQGSWELLRTLLNYLKEKGPAEPEGGPEELDERLRQRLSSERRSD